MEGIPSCPLPFTSTLTHESTHACEKERKEGGGRRTGRKEREKERGKVDRKSGKSVLP